MKTQLDEQQSQHLLELGVPREKMTQLVEHKGLIPIVEKTFSLTNLLEIMPKEIVTESDENMCLELQMLNNHCNVSYEYIYHGGCMVYYNAKELIDALYELTVWCIENGHLKFN